VLRLKNGNRQKVGEWCQGSNQGILAKGGYRWAVVDVRDQSSLFRWSHLLNSWLNCTPVISKGVSGDIVSLERVSAIDRVCHGQEGATEKFFYMYMCHFSQLHV